ncbi:MAG: thioredoxin family protein [Chitinophagaceae bacterium]|nr:thioredoxin family protein [Chitinophagaceae bacterium]
MKKYFLFIITFLFSIASFAQIITDATKWSFETKKIKDNDYEFKATCSLKKDWHIWSFNPGGDGFLVAPSFNFDKNKNIQLVGKPQESGKLINEEFPGVDGITHYFEDKVVYTQKFKATDNTELKGKIRFQVCDHSQCLAPEEKKFSVKVTGVEKAATDTAKTAIAPEVINTDTPKATENIEENNVVASPAPELKTATENNTTKGEQRSNWLLLLEGIAGGLLAIITPCVFAMLPMTVSFFIKKSKDRKSGIKVALQYSLSLVIIFALFGLLLTLVNNKNILYEFSTHWVTNVVFFLVFLVFAFSFLGAFELALPSKWSTFTDKKANTNSLSGIFFMALTLAIVSFSCTAPFLGGLISEISRGAKIGPFFGFTGFGIGLAIPFTLFVVFPQLLQALNKQGGWLNAVKVTFGFIELALAFKFLSNADLQKSWRLLDREIFLAIWIVIAFALAMYLFGLIRFRHDSPLPDNDWGLPHLTVTRTMFALATLMFAFYLIPGMWGAPLNGMGAFVPPMGTQDFVLSGGGNSGGNNSESHENKNRYFEQFKIYEPEVVKKHGMNTYFDYHDALKASKEQKKPIMLDFTGITCVNCRKMETQVWSNEEVFNKMKNEFIVVSLFADAIQVPIPESEQYESKFLGSRVLNLGQKNSDIQAAKYNSNTQPYYFFIDENEHLLAPKGYGYNPDAAAFAKHLDQVLAAFKKNNP